MKRKSIAILLILMIFLATIALSSCDFVLTVIFGPSTPTDTPDNNEPPAHTHQMTAEAYVGETCAEQKEITYYRCKDCGKCYLDADGELEIADMSALGGHIYVVKHNDSQHYRECALCNTEQDDSRGQHASDRWWYNPDNHYKLCDVCGVVFESGSHDEIGSCSVCGRQANYKEICNGNYAYEQLAAFERGADMKKLYNKIDDLVSSVHDNKNVNVSERDIGETEDGKTVYAYALNKIDITDCLISVEDAYATVASYAHDHPLYYWLDKSCSVTRQNVENRAVAVTLCVVDDYADGAARVEQNKTLYAEIDKYLSAVSTETDPYYITLGLHDKTISDIDYANRSDGTPESAPWAHSIVGVFDRKSAVCEGYAKAFQLLLNACDVENIYVVGSSRNIGHAWNTVKLLDGNWYWYDLTWDDQPNLSGGITYNYFCKTDSVFDKDHTVSDVRTGINYLYDLPQTATVDYESVGWEIGENISVDNVTYTLAGYDRLAVNKILSVGDDGVITIPASIQHNDKTFTVRQINDEALITYTYDAMGKVISKAGPNVTKLEIPDTVDLIYNKSIFDCSTLTSIEFKDVNNWQRYGLNDQTPVYEQISADKLSLGSTACALVKQLYKQSLLSPSYYCVWIKSA